MKVLAREFAKECVNIVNAMEKNLESEKGTVSQKILSRKRK